LKSAKPYSDVRIEPLLQYPRSYPAWDITGDPHDWKNQCLAQFSGVGSVSFGAPRNVPLIPFFAVAVDQGNGTYFENLPGGKFFGYFAYIGSSIISHADLGYESIMAANDGANGIYLYDFKSGHWWYTNPSAFPFLHDFTLKAWIYYFPAQGSTGHYSSNPRNFVNMTTGQFFTM
jgi:hypothetical protein